MSTVNPSIGAIVNCDVLIVGAGFSGISALHNACKLGLNAKVFESGTDFGGVWYWNRYPGARVDSEYPFYQLNIDKAYRSFDYEERFPGDNEIRKYFAHLDRTLDLRKDVQFEALVNDVRYDEKEAKWTVKTAAGHIATCKYLILATGLLHRRHYPDFPGLKNYKGVVHHSGFWPEDFNCKGKKVAVVGAGATSVQIIQELAKETANGGSLTMFMRRPSTCLPMAQRKLSAVEQREWRTYYPSLFREGRSSSSGFPTKGPDCGVHDVSEDERMALFEELWSRGGMAYLWGNYNDLLIDLKANRTVYDFWAKKVRARMTDPVKKDLMAPLEPAYPFGTKRCPLEQDYYECLDMDHVDIVNLDKTALKSFTEKGILTEDGIEKEFDVVVLATGFDSFTGS
jgi:cation diffusion facilitator CzcD-associated flavoprotein CzcO